MKRAVCILTLLLASLGVVATHDAFAYNYGDFRSVTLVSKAWEALDKGDVEAVLAYTNKCIELYAAQAKKMQESMTEYATGENQNIFSYWALNDVATSYFIQGEAYRKAQMQDEAKAAYRKIISDYKFGQCWDPKGWFWKPAEAAQEKIAMLDSGSNLDFGDYSSAALTKKAWEALEKKDADSVKVYTDKCLELYAKKAKEMQDSLTEYPWESKDKIFSYWALNDVGTCLYIRGEAFMNAGNADAARDAYKRLVDEYFYAQCWDPNGWFWKPAEAAQQKLDEMGQKT